MSNIATGANQTIQIRINRWSSPSQRKQLIETFLKDKLDRLLSRVDANGISTDKGGTT